VVVDILENLRDSYDYANNALRSFSDWIILIMINLLTVVCIAVMIFGIIGFAVTPVGTIASESSTLMMEGFPFVEMVDAFFLIFLCIGAVFALIFDILWTGFTLRVYRGGELKLGTWSGMFLEGLLATIISFVYFIPYLLISVLLEFYPIDDAAYVLVAAIIEYVVILITCMAVTMALIQFAKQKLFSAAFHMKKLFNIITTIGWLRYLGNIIVVGIILLVVYVILLLIPVIGWALLIVVAPLLTIWEARFFANLYESAIATSTSSTAIEE
jgi:hypothetical protein